MSKALSRFGPYELQRRLGAGGMAETFLALRRGPGGFEQRVCLKRILPAFEEDAEFVRLFLEEARIAARLRHTNVVQVLDFGVVEGSHFLALELVEGLDMRDLLDQLKGQGEAMTSGLVSYLAFELGAALDFAHAAGPDGVVHGVVHRDISPSNVLLSNAGEVKLTDFGIAKAMNKTHVTKSGVIKGKVPYMAPEYALAMQFDARSDLFALGVTLYEALAGKRPFDGVTELDTLRRIQDGEHTPLAEVVPSAPRALVDAIERLISPDAGARFGNAAELLDALVDVAPPPTSRRILGELVRRCAARKEASRPVSTAPPAAEEIGYAATMHGTPKGTAVLGRAAPLAAAEVQSAAPDAETRTRLPTPSGQVVTTRAGDDVETDELTARTELDAEVAHARSVADAETRPLAAGGSPAEPVATVPVATPRRATPAWVWAALAGVLVVGGGGAAWLAASGGGPAEAAASQDGAPREVPAAAGSPMEPTPEVTVAGEGASPSATERAPEPPADEEPAVEPPRPQSGGEASGRAAPPAPAEPDPPPSREPPAERPARAPGGLGTINVIVVPFGDVWVDGRMVGTSPVTLEVPAGRHVVATGDGAPTRRTTVTVTAGQRRRVVIR